jgi:MFS family permease
MHAAYVFVVATTLPAIVADIGGIVLYAWVTTVFVVGSVGGSAIAASLAGRLGLRAAYRLATALFVAGGGTCAMAPGMSVLLTGRALQGLGGGLLTALAYTTIRQALPEVLRSRAIAMVSGVWGVAALSGPLLGGVFAAPNRWRDAFWLAVPLGLSYIAVTEYVLPKRSLRVEAAPVAGARLALLGAAALAVSAGSVPGRFWPSTAGILAAAILMAALFALDRRAQIRLLPAGAFNARTPLGAISLTMALLVVGTGTMPFVPYVLRVAYGHSPIVAGYVGALQALGWTCAALVTASAGHGTARRIIAWGPIVMAVGFLGVAQTLYRGSLPLTATAWAIVGVGIGMGWAHLGNLMIRAAAAPERDLAAAFISTTQLIALAFGSALAGMVANLGGLPGARTPVEVARAAFWLFAVFAVGPAAAFVSAGRVLSLSPAPSPLPADLRS